MKRFAFALWLAAVPHVALAKHKQACAEKCSTTVKVCADQCNKNFPRDKAEQCRKACKASTDVCQDQCMKEKSP